MQPIGYTHSGDFELYPKHADYGRMVDEDNDTGFVYSISSIEETESNISCGVCGEIILPRNLFYDDD